MKVQEHIVPYLTLINDFSTKAISNLGHCMVPDKSIKEFEHKIMSNGLKIASKEVFEKINKIMPSKELATIFVLQELDYSKGGNLESLDFVLSSGFETCEYLGAFEKFEAQQNDLKEVQEIYENFLLKIRNKNLMEMSARDIVDRMMKAWSLGKYDSSKPVIPKVSVEELKVTKKTVKKEEPKPEPVVAVPEYTMEMVEDLIEEYTDVIPYMIEDITVMGQAKEELAEFKEAMVEASKQGDSLAHVFLCFFEKERALPIDQIDNEGHDFLLEILNSFSKKKYSPTFREYLKNNKEIVHRLAEENTMLMQYLMGFWYAFDERDEKGDEHCAKIQLHWYERAALNGYAPAIVMMGSFYDTHPHLPKDLTKAAKWYREGALLDDVKNAYYLGCMYAIGEGVLQDKKIAQMWLSVAYNLANDKRKKQIEEDAEQFKITLVDNPDRRLDKTLEEQVEESLGS